MRCSAFMLLVLVFSIAMAALRGAESRSTIEDYFLLLPPKTFESPPASWLPLMKSAGGGVIDRANGYLRCSGDGAEAPFTAALFRFKDDRPLLAVSFGELEGEESISLALFELGSDGQMKKARRGLFPIRDGKGRQFLLPRQGRTVVVTGGTTGRADEEFVWDGEKFRSVISSR